MASAYPPPDPSATFDSLWDDFDEPEAEPIPAALAPSRPLPAELRDTLLPPVPPPEYVQTMMELGELDDPSGAAAGPAPPRPAPPRPRPRPPRPAPPARGGDNSLGLVMASEDELLLPTDEAATPAPIDDDTVQIRGALGSPAMPGRIAGMNRATSAVARGAPVISGAPAPRAPSIPPIAHVMEEFDLELMPFDEPEAASPSPAPAPLLPNARQTGGRPGTPPQRAQQTTPPKSGGFRLGKTPPPMAAVDDGDRVTSIPSEPPPPDSVIDHARVMAVRFEAKNYPGALVLAESILVSSPNHAAAKRTAESCRDLMAEKYLSRIGGRNCVPRLLMAPAEVHRLALDHRAGFLLSFIDGAMSVDEVLDVSSMPELDALRIMFELQEQGAITIEPPARRPGRK